MLITAMFYPPEEDFCKQQEILTYKNKIRFIRVIRVPVFLPNLSSFGYEGTFYPYKPIHPF